MIAPRRPGWQHGSRSTVLFAGAHECCVARSGWGALNVRPSAANPAAALDGEDRESLAGDLARFLGHEGYLWLSALASCPALPWDMTLYLGVSVPRWRRSAVGWRSR